MQVQSSLRNKKRDKENEKNYTWASSHEDINGCFLMFALRITKANSFLKCCQQASCDGWIPRKNEIISLHPNTPAHNYNYLHKKGDM